jgi:hypothetical protein
LAFDLQQPLIMLACGSCPWAALCALVHVPNFLHVPTTEAVPLANYYAANLQQANVLFSEMK